MNSLLLPEAIKRTSLHDQLSTILDDVIPYGQVAAATRTATVLERLAHHAFLRICHSEENGGQNIGNKPGTSRELFRILSLIGKTDLAAGRIYEGHVNAVLLMLQHATREQRERWQDNVASGHWFGVWNTDAQPGVSFTREGDEICLSGAKYFCSGARRVTRGLITAIGEDGRRQMLIVPMELLAPERVDDTGWTPLGMQSSDSFYIDFTGLRLPSHTLLGEGDAYLREPWLTGGAIRFAAVQFGGVEALADAMYSYIRSRGRAQDPFQQYRAGEIAIAVTSGRNWLEHAASHHDNALARSTAHDLSDIWVTSFLTDMRMARAAIEKIATDVLQYVDRSIGANGFLEPLPFAQLHRDLTMYLRQPAPDAVITAIGREYLM